MADINIEERIDMLMTLFDEEQIMKNHEATFKRENQIDSVRSLMETLKSLAQNRLWRH